MKRGEGNGFSHPGKERDPRFYLMDHSSVGRILPLFINSQDVEDTMRAWDIDPDIYHVDPNMNIMMISEIAKRCREQGVKKTVLSPSLDPSEPIVVAPVEGLIVDKG